MPLLYLILGIILARLFWRQLTTAAAVLVCGGACYALLRAAPMIGVSSDAISVMYAAGALGLVGGVLVAWRVVVNHLVNQDRARGHDRVDAEHDKRLV